MTYKSNKILFCDYSQFLQ